MNILITGGASGLGAAVKRRFVAANTDGQSHIYDIGLETGQDLSDENDVMDALTIANGLFKGRLDVLVNCAGYNYLNWIEEIPVDEWDRVMGANAKAIFLMAKRFSKIMRSGTICNIISNASHVPMTHSLAYNASKGAAAIMTRQMAKELWATHDITVFGVSPNKLKHTGMTEHVDRRAAALRNITPAEAHSYQLSKLLIGEETDPDCVAELVVWLLSEKRRHKYLAGCILEYGA